MKPSRKRKNPRRADLPETAELNTISREGNIPGLRLTTPTAAWAIYEELFRNDKDLALDRARIQGMIDGNKPWRPEKLREMHQEWRTNFNTRETEAIIDQRAEGFWKLTESDEYLVRFTVPYGVETDPAVDIAEVAARHFTAMLRKWKGRHLQTMRRFKQILTTGHGPIYWPDEYDWHFKSMKASNFYTTSAAECDTDELDIVILRDTMKVADVRRKLELGDKATEEGWDLKGLKTALIRIYFNKEYPDIHKNVGTYWDELQSMSRNRTLDLIERNDFKDLPILHFLVREWSTGSITEIKMLETGEARTFLYNSPNKYEKMSHAVQTAYYDIGTGEHRSVRGLGARIFAHGDLSNRFFCESIDAGRLSASVLLEPEGEPDADKLRHVRQGPFTILAPGVRAAQTAFNPNFSGLIALRNVSSSILNNNVGNFKPNSETLRQPEKTLGQFQLELQNEAQFAGNKAAWFYLGQDLTYEEMYRRVMNPRYPSFCDGYAEKEKFIKDCEREGVSRDQLAQLEISSSRMIGLGSPSAQFSISEDIWNKQGALSDKGRYRAQRLYFATRVGPDNVDQFVQRRGQGQLLTRDTTEAWLENNDAANGQSMPVVPEQDHVVHTTVHLSFLGGYVKAYQEKPDAVPIDKAVIAFQTLFPHIGEHLKRLEQDPTRMGEYKALSQQARTLVHEFRPILIVYVNMRKAQQRQQQDMQQAMDPTSALRDPKFMLQLQRMRQQMALGQIEQESLNAMRKQKTDVQTRIALDEAASRIRIKEAEAASKLKLQEA